MSASAPSVAPPLALGVIGLGMAGAVMVHAAALHPGIRLVAGADPQPRARDAFAAQFHGRPYADAAELCADPEVEAVYIATPHQFHRPHAIMAAENGKHIVVEKPLALTLEDCDAIAAAVARAKVRLVVGHTHGFDPAVQAIRDLVQSGAFGALGLIAMWNYTNFMYRPRRPEELDTSLGGGVVFNQLPHQIDSARMIGGEIRSVRAHLARLDPSRPTEGLAAAFLRFESGAAASLTYSGYDHFDSDEIYGWVAESGAPKRPDQHGAARRELTARAQDEAAMRTQIYALGARPFSPSPHQPHFGAMVVSCAQADLRPTPDGLMIYGREGAQFSPLDRQGGVPGRREVLDEIFEAVRFGRPALHDAHWGR
ncbi:MAG TPA: Gfo/Idh/MocA family oxidoreductase, partial [Beijerinckiaceae bacterium]|nr:Gfo/Idh/MocA family oxidoreductase [Beijerinckiaceae bacterium]